MSLIASTAIVLAHPAHAASYYWNTANGTWTSNASWSNNATSGGTTGVLPGAADNVTFNQSSVNGNQTIGLGANQTTTGITFANTGTTLLQGGGANQTLTIGTGGLTVNSGAGAVTVGNVAANQNVSIKLSGNQTWANNATSLLTIVNGVTNTGNVTAFTLTSGGTGNTTISGAISNGGTVGTTALTKTGAGRLTLSGTNTYTGATTVNGGTLAISTDAQLGTAPGAPTANMIVLNNGGTLTVSSSGATINANRGLNLAGNGTLASTGANALIYRGIVTGPGALTLSLVTAATEGQFGSSNATLSSYSGGTVIASGSKFAMFNNSVGSASTGNLTSGDFGTGTITMNDASIRSTTAGSRTIGNAITLQGNLTKHATGTGTDVSLTFDGPVTITGATRTLINNSNAATALLALSGNISEGTSGLGLTFNSTAGRAVLLSGTNTYTGTTTVTGGALRANDGVGLPAASFLSLNGGVLESNGVATFSRNIGVSGASNFQFTANGGGFSASGGQLTVNVGGAGAPLTWGSDINGTLQFGSATASAKTLFQNGIALNSANRTINVNAGLGSDSAEISGAISGSGVGLTKNGTGVLVLSGANTYDGGTTVNAGTLDYFNTSAVPVTGNTTVAAGAGLALGIGSSPTYFTTADVDTLFATQALGNITLNGTSSVGIDTSLGDLTYSTSVASTNLGLTKVGANKLILTGTNSYNGTTRINEGTLQIGDGVTDGSISTTANVVNNSTLAFNLVGSQSLDKVISGLGVLTKLGAGTLTLNATNTFTGNTTITAGTLVAPQAGSLGAGSVVNNATLNLTGGGLTYTGLSTALSGNGTTNVTLGTGSGSTILNGNYSAYTGTWNIGIGAAANAGKVQMNGLDNAATVINVLTHGTVYATGAVTHNATVVLNGGDTGEALGQLRLEGGVTWAGPVTLAGSITGAGDAFVGSNTGQTATISGIIGETGGNQTLSKVGGGTVILTASNTYTGGTVIVSGPLQVGNGGTTGSLGSGPITNNGTLVFNRSNSFSVGELIGGTGALTKNGANGTLTLTNTNTYGGITKILGGTLEVSTIGNFNNVGGSNLGTASAAGLTNTAAATATSTNSIQMGDSTVATGGKEVLRYIGAGETTDRAIYLFTQDIATIDASGSGALTLTGPISWYIPNVTTALNSNLILSGSNAGGNTFTGTFAEGSNGSGKGLNIDKQGSGTWALTGNKSNTGLTIVEEGILKFDSVANTGTDSALGKANSLRLGTTPVTYSIVLGNATAAGTLEYTGAASSSTNRTTVLSGNGTISTGSAAGTLTFTGGITALNAGAKTLTLAGSNAGANAISGIIGNGAGALALAKSGSGSWTISGNNTYTGSTTVSSGTLIVSGGGTLNTTSDITVLTGATLTNDTATALTPALALGEGSALSGTGNFNPTAMTLTGNLADGFTPVTAGSTLTKAGALTFTLSGVTDGTYSLFTGSPSSSFTSVNVGGSPLTFDGGDNLWKGNVGGFDYAFSDVANTLSVAAIPEPKTWALIGLGLGFTLFRFSARSRRLKRLSGRID